jgi:hypothetical protein
MLRALLVCFGIALFTWLGFRSFPGHTYLQSDTQIYLPMLERLESPGFLSRDPVATRPHVSFTIYDEVALSVRHVTHWNFEEALVSQQLLFRAGAMLGICLIATSAGVPAVYALLIAALLNLGASVVGPGILLVEYEPVPRGFALALIFLALGLLAHRLPLMAGLVGDLAFLYHPPTTAPFWGMALLGFLADRYLRSRWKPLMVALFIAILLLANMAQLQPEVVEPQNMFGHLSRRIIEYQQMRTPYSWVSFWAGSDMWHYLVIWICGLWATARIWPFLKREVRWFFIGMPLGGILCVPLSYLLLERLHLAIVPEFQPARALVYTVAIASIACAIAAVKAGLDKRFAECFAWFLVTVAMPIDVRVLNLFRLTDAVHFQRFAVWIVLSALAALVVRYVRRPWLRIASWGVPAIAIFLIPTAAHVVNYPTVDKAPVIQLADWAKSNTWGSSMFLFPDAGHSLKPGIFRALSKRALYVDWKSGSQVNYFESFGDEWYSRYEHTMSLPFTARRLEKMLSLPIDYYVLNHDHRLKGIRPVFENSEFVVYDAQDLRNSSTSLRIGTDG